MRKIGLLVLLMLQGCVSNDIRPLRPYELAVAPYHYGESEALVGSLMYEGGCLLFVTDDKSRQLLPVWPTGSTFEEQLITFHEPAKAEQRMILGEQIRLDGQLGDWTKLDDPQFAPFRQQCRAEPFFVTAVRPAN